MGRIIECCVRNVDEGVSERMRAGEDTVRIRPCLERCGVCRDRPFLVVDGELITPRHLLDSEDAVERGLTSPRSQILEDEE